MPFLSDGFIIRWFDRLILPQFCKLFHLPLVTQPVLKRTGLSHDCEKRDAVNDEERGGEEGKKKKGRKGRKEGRKKGGRKEGRKGGRANEFLKFVF